MSTFDILADLKILKTFPEMDYRVQCLNWSLGVLVHWVVLGAEGTIDVPVALGAPSTGAIAGETSVVL